MTIEDGSNAGIKLRVMLDGEVAIGPGKADLLDMIRETGSIAAAGRRMGMSYKRAWYLVDTMNHCFSAPLVEASKGGKSGGGAVLTPMGAKVLECYRRLVEASLIAMRNQLEPLLRKSGDIPERK